MSSVKGEKSIETMVIQGETKVVTSSDENVTLADTNVVATGLIVMGTSASGVDATKGNMPTTDISANTASIAAISDGKLDITIDGTLTQVESIDFTGDASIADVAATLVTALAALDVTITEALNIITFESDSTGTSSTIVVAAGTGTGTNVVDTGLIVMDTAVDGADATSGADPTVDITANVAAIIAIDDGKLSINIDGAGATQVRGFDFTGATTASEVADVLSDVLSDYAVTITESSGVITFTSDSTGSSSSVEILAGTGSGNSTFIICDALVDATVTALDMNGESRVLFVPQGNRKDIMLTKIVETDQTIIIGS